VQASELSYPLLSLVENSLRNVIDGPGARLLTGTFGSQLARIAFRVSSRPLHRNVGGMRVSTSTWSLVAALSNQQSETLFFDADNLIIERVYSSANLGLGLPDQAHVLAARPVFSISAVPAVFGLASSVFSAHVFRSV